MRKKRGYQRDTPKELVRGTDEQLRTIADYCSENPNWHIVISNPCFEVWLYFHKEAQIPNTDMTCKALKTEAAQLEKGGYSPAKFIPNLFDAISNAENVDSDKAHFLPNLGETKIYQLGKALIEIIGKKDFEAFLKKL